MDIIAKNPIVRLYFQKKHKKAKISYPKDVVILHQIQLAAKDKPTVCSSCLKLETW